MLNPLATVMTAIGAYCTCFDALGPEPIDVLSGCGIADEERVALWGFEDLIGVVVGEVVHLEGNYKLYWNQGYIIWVGNGG